MAKKCILCEEAASFTIKGSSETYCRDCALVSFSDLELLQQLEDNAQIVHDLVDERVQEP